jgi:hypothetical protein
MTEVRTPNLSSNGEARNQSQISSNNKSLPTMTVELPHTVHTKGFENSQRYRYFNRQLTVS